MPEDAVLGSATHEACSPFSCSPILFFFSCLDSFKVSSSWPVFISLIMISLSVVFSMLILFVGCSASWICGLTFSSALRMFGHYSAHNSMDCGGLAGRRPLLNSFVFGIWTLFHMVFNLPTALSSPIHREVVGAKKLRRNYARSLEPGLGARTTACLPHSINREGHRLAQNQGLSIQPLPPDGWSCERDVAAGREITGRKSPWGARADSTVPTLWREESDSLCWECGGFNLENTGDTRVMFTLWGQRGHHAGRVPSLWVYDSRRKTHHLQPASDFSLQVTKNEERLLSYSFTKWLINVLEP